MRHKNKYLVHINSDEMKIYKLEKQTIQLQYLETVNIENTFKLEKWSENIYSNLKEFFETNGELKNTDIKFYVTGMFTEMNVLSKLHLINHFFVYTGFYLNIVPPDLEQFYMRQIWKDGYENNFVEGLVRQEFRKIVVCGSFQQHLNELGEIKRKLEKKGTNVLSPWTTKVVPESLGTDFIRLEGQKELKNKRDTWTHKFEHMEKFMKSDAIVICNPDGVIGQGTMFEFGFMVAHSKRIIFTDEPKDLSIYFPYEIGLNFLD